MTLINKIIQWAILGLLVAVMIICYRWAHRTPQILFNREKITQINMDSVQHWKDQAGREHAQRIVAEGDAAQLRYYYGPLMDTVLKTLNIQGRRLESVTAFSTDTRGHVLLRVDTVYVNDNKYLRYRGTDGFLTLSGTTNDSFADYTYRDSIITAAFWKKRPFLKGGIWGKKDLYVDAFSLNPNSKIDQVSTLKIADKSFDRINLDIYGGALYNKPSISAYAGAALRFYVSRRTSVELNGQYNISDQLGIKPLVGVRARYTLIKF